MHACLTSARAATSFYTAIYRRWGCETAQRDARLRLARAYLAAGGDARAPAEPPVRPSTQGMLTISRSPPRPAPRPACWAARLGACAFFPPTAGCPATRVNVAPLECRRPFVCFNPCAIFGTLAIGPPPRHARALGSLGLGLRAAAALPAGLRPASGCGAVVPGDVSGRARHRPPHRPRAR
jgi:hypothetical protein